ncbi:MAG: glycoside hydrolase family 2 [Clostridia bacterium]|nr:glycoside hydrolase family 2 [Clostridia bacterium]
MLNHLYTKQGRALPEIPHNTYPRPALKRASFFCLNGSWDFCVVESERKIDYNEKIVVPFAPESLLSGINRTFKEGTLFCYRREFSLPEGFVKARVILNFGAVNQQAKIILNGELIGKHSGGYTPFSFDITSLLRIHNTLEIIAKNDFDSFVFPYGKQCRKRGGMWYTAASGIWQSVWLESVSENYIKDVKITADMYKASFEISGADEGEIIINTPEGEVNIPFGRGRASYKPESPCNWSPENPYLYYCTVISGEDRVETYFALRSLEIGKINGVPRTMLNGKPYFFHGLLDQGYFSDGIFTPAAPELFEQDIKTAKSLGFNMLRKHIKIEPQQFYYDCDRLGMVVFQDMVNNGKYSFLRDTALPTIGVKRLPAFLLGRTKEQKQEFYNALKETVELLWNHPSVCCYTIFNEGWGQFDEEDMYLRIKMMKTGRLIDTASGWFKTDKNDFESLHVYFKKIKIKPSSKPIFLSEFGGYSFKPKNHVFNTEKTYGYKMFDNKKEFQKAFISLYENEVIPAIKTGLCATVYTQLTDVEDETNGLISCDREVVKVNKDKLKALSQKIFNEFAKITK